MYKYMNTFTSICNKPATDEYVVEFKLANQIEIRRSQKTVGMQSLRFCSNPVIFSSFSHKLGQFKACCFNRFPLRSSSSQPHGVSFCPIANSSDRNEMKGSGSLPPNLLSDSPSNFSLPSGLEEAMMGYLLGRRKATEVAHSVWSQVLQKGDVVVDATCGNGYDTIAMLKMVADQSCRGRVYSMDIQETAIESSLFLLDQFLNPDEKKLVQLSVTCHSKMEEIVPKGITVRLVAFNLGYLPGGDKSIITVSKTTLLALEAAKRIVSPGGLISILVYVGHSGGREELEAAQAFASRLSAEEWVCSKLEMLNRPLAPVLILLFKR